jgi:hypothetical protein
MISHLKIINHTNQSKHHYQINMTHHNVWFKRWFNPTLRKLFKVEICSLIDGETVIGYGIRKYKKLC